MSSKKLLSTTLAAAMCLNLFVGTGFAVDDDVGSDPNGSLPPGEAEHLAEQRSDSEGTPSAEQETGDSDAWTICIYMCGSDLESGNGAATADLIEMLKSIQTGVMDVDGATDFPDDVNLLVMTGGATAWDPFGAGASAAEGGVGYIEPSTERIELFKITPDEGMVCLDEALDDWIKSDANVENWELPNNMAVPDPGKIFGGFAVDAYPAEHMMYSFWDHGGAFISGCEVDEFQQYEADAFEDMLLSSAQVDDIIDTVVEMRGQKIDLVGFDACLMSCMELAGALADSASYLLASEEIEPGSGWQYLWLGALFREGTPADDVTAADLSQEVIDLYPIDFSAHDVQPDGLSLYTAEGGCDGTDSIWNHAEEATLALIDLGKIDSLIDDFDEMAAAMNAIVRDEAFSDHIADLGYAISRSAGSQNQNNLLDVYEYAESIMSLYTDTDSNLYQHQSMHEECQALFRAAERVSDYFTFNDEETGAASEDNSGALLSGTGDNPVLYRGKGAQAARGGLSVFGPVLSSKSVDADSDTILTAYKDCGLDDAVLKNYSAFIPALKSRKEDVGSFTGNMRVFSETDGDDLAIKMQVKPRSTGVSVVDVSAQVAYTDLSTGQTYRLGEMPVQSNRRDMEFSNVFDGTWKAVGNLDDDGPAGETLCTMNIESDGSGYRIPAYVEEDGKRVPALVSASRIASMVDDDGKTLFLIQARNYRKLAEEPDGTITDRTVSIGKNPGQKDKLIFYPVLVREGSEIDDPKGWTELDASITVEAMEDYPILDFTFSMKDVDLESGRNNLYEARFALTDIMGETFFSDSVPFFVINDLKDFSILPIRPQIYEEGKPAEPPVRLFFDDTDLVLGEDYTVEYRGNEGVPTPGSPVTASVTITGIGDLSGTRTLDFLICMEEDYETAYMNWIADILKATEHTPGDEGMELGAAGLLLDMMNPLDEYIIHAVLAEELQLRYDLCTTAERGFFTQDRLDAMRRHYSGAVRNTTLTNNGVTLVGALKLMDLYGCLTLIDQPESELKVTTGQPDAAQLVEYQVDAQYFTQALADARGQNGSVATAQIYNPIFQVNAPVSSLAWGMVLETLGEGESIDTLDEAELMTRYETAMEQIHDTFGDVEYVQHTLRQTGESEDLRLVLKVAVPSGYYENTASLYRIDGTGFKKLGQEDGLHFVTENGVSYAVFETRALHEGCWYAVMAEPKPAANTGSGGAWHESRPSNSNVSNQSNHTDSDTEKLPEAPDTPDTPDVPDTDDTPNDTQRKFIDVPADAWYTDAVDFVERRGLMRGSNGRFSPDENLSRGMLAQILFNAEGKPAGSAAANFSDVGSGDWFADAVAWAAAQNIVSGYGNGRFGPNDSITREQLAVMLWRYAGSPAPTAQTLSFSDAHTASEFAHAALCWAVEKGIMNGNGGRLDPKGPATRAQVAQMLKNYLEN